MLWFIIHHIVQNLISASDQTKNLITFLSGTVFYTLLYAYLGALDYTNHKFGKYLFNFFIYIVIADAIAIAIIYKNFYKQTIFNEITKVIGKPNIATDEVYTADDVDAINENTIDANPIDDNTIDE